MEEFWVNFLANLAADALLAIAIYIIVTQPGEKKKQQEIRKQSLGLLKAEILVNFDRAQEYIESFIEPDSVSSTLFPLRYTRGAWNTLKDSGFLASIGDPILSYHLFRMNETALVANKNLRRYQIAVLDGKMEKLESLANEAKRDSEILIIILNKLIAILENVKVPSIVFDDIVSEKQIEKVQGQKERIMPE